MTRPMRYFSVASTVDQGTNCCMYLGELWLQPPLKQQCTCWGALVRVASRSVQPHPSSCKTESVQQIFGVAVQTSCFRGILDLCHCAGSWRVTFLLSLAMIKRSLETPLTEVFLGFSFIFSRDFVGFSLALAALLL